jgi:hypothetical protein
LFKDCRCCTESRISLDREWLEDLGLSGVSCKDFDLYFLRCEMREIRDGDD